MTGLNLTGALRNYEEGKQWKLENDQRNDVNAANQAGAQAVQQAHQASLAQQQQQWTTAGNDPAAFKPSSTTPDENSVVAGFNARGDALAQRGRWQEFADNEAKAAPVRNTLRQRTISRALQDYDATGDAMALAKAAYPTYHDGVSIVGGGRDTLGGQSFANASSGVEAARQQWVAAGHSPESFVPPNMDDATNGGRYTIHLSNGGTMQTTGQQLRDMAASALANPEQTAAFEFESRKNAALTKAQIAREVAKAQATGAEARRTAEVNHGFKASEIGLTNQGNVATAQERNKGLIGSANIHAGATMAAAGTSAEARRYAADQGLAGRKELAAARVAGSNPATKRMTAVQLTDQARLMFGESKPGAFGAANSASMDTGAIAARADSIRRQNPGVPDIDALLQAGKEYGFHGKIPPGIQGSKAGASAPAGASSGPSISNWSAAPAAAPGLSMTGSANVSGYDDGTDGEEG